MLRVQSLQTVTVSVRSRTCTPIMSSSCLPPRNCVVHNPDPSGHDDHSDTSSECGSLCTCTSGSMASIATIGSNNRVPDRLGQEGECAALVSPLPGTPVVPQAEDNATNGYLLVRVPQRVICCRKLKSFGFTASLRHFLLTSCEFFPWLAGFVIIYYSYRWWGMASGFSAFLFMIGAHAFLRLIKTRGVLGCVPYSSQTQVESDSSVSTTAKRTFYHSLEVSASVTLWRRNAHALSCGKSCDNTTLLYY